MKKWIAKINDNYTITEDDINWHNLDHASIKGLKLEIDGQIIELPDGMEYVQGKTASAMLGSSEYEIESRYCGIKLGTNIIKIRVNEKNNNISVEIE